MLEAWRASEQEAAAANLAATLSPGRVEFAEARTLEALRGCLDRLPGRSRELMFQYYQDEKIAKIENRKALASRLNIPLNALRSRAFRIRAWLENCVEKSLRLPGTPPGPSASGVGE
jgi:DNA-directed RNA polymerase specialized sigma24 family protein